MKCYYISMIVIFFLVLILSSITFSILIWISIRMDVDFKVNKLKKLIFFLIQTITVGVLFYGAHLGAKAAERI